ncbi:hypothetical protein [Desulfobacter curvatus]|uniref:hypothetical protein n=1 Tax=Desulfobacter curvatus TaxID=2290 RepID=UPI0003818F27|nr:hypothetical protein [Desulfobacter curvatus]
MNQSSPTQKESVGKIDKVDAPHSAPSPENKWIPVLKAFNPLGAIAEAYARTLAYKIEAKRLDAELERINKQAEIAHDVIDKTYCLKMEELKHRRIALIGFYQTVNAELERLHIERREVLEMAKLAQKKTFEPNITLEERQMYKDMTTEITRELPKFGEKSNESLKNLVEALPPVEISPRLLEG